MTAMKIRLETAKTEAMKAKLTAADKVAASLRLDAIRAALTSVAKAETNSKERRELTDEDVIAVLRKEVAQRVESARVYREAGQVERAAKEEAEAEVFNEFLPQLLDETATRELVASLVAEAGATSMRDIGKVMGAMKARTDLDKGLASKIAKELLS